MKIYKLRRRSDGLYFGGKDSRARDKHKPNKKNEKHREEINHTTETNNVAMIACTAPRGT